MEQGRRSAWKSMAAALPPLGLLCLLGSFGWALWRRDFDPLATGLGALGALAFLTVFLRAELPNWKHHVNTWLYSLFVIGIAACLYALILRHDRQYDLTPQGIHTLSEGTEQFLRLLKKDVQIVAFDTNDKPYRRLLDRYAALTPRVSWSLQDPRKDPLFTAQFAASVDLETVYIRCGDRKKKIAAKEMDENTLTNGIVEVTREGKTKLYFMSGHGELEFQESADGKSKPPLAEFRDALLDRAIEVGELNLVERGYIPQDATALVLAGPARDLYSVEVRQIEEYFDRGGKLLVFFDLPRPGGSADFSRLGELLRRRGIQDANYVIVDLEGKRLAGSQLNVPILWMNDKHPITDPVRRSGAPLNPLPLVRSLGVLQSPPPNLKIWPLIGSSNDAWSAPYEKLGESLEAGATPSGVQPMGWAVEGEKPKGDPRPPMRLVVYGSSALADNRFITASNGDMALMLNTVNWLSEGEDLIPVPPRLVRGTPLALDAGQLRLILILVVLAFPSAIFFGGISYVRLIRRG